jgi:hypothetical protein
MPIELEAGKTGQFPTVIWLDADERSAGINLVFGSRIEGQGAALRIKLSRPQWENLKFLVDGPKM